MENMTAVYVEDGSSGRAVEGLVFTSLPVVAFAPVDAQLEAHVLAADGLGLVPAWDRVELGVFVGLCEPGGEAELRVRARRMLLEGGGERLH